MSYLAAAKAANAKLALDGAVAVVVGGTGGIGAALAVKIAQYSKKPVVHIVGRNDTSAQNVISQMKSVNPDGQYEFHKCDVTLLSQVHPLIRELRTSLPRITHLVVTQGILTTAGRTETPEGNDSKMMLHYYSRYLFMRGLEPSLSAATGRVISVYDSARGNKNKLNWEDLDLKKKGNFSLGAAADHCTTMNDITIQRLALQHPSISYTHAYPGVVDTDGYKGVVPNCISVPVKWMLKAFGTSSLDCADVLLHAMQTGEPGQPHYVDNHGKPVKGKVMANEEEMDKILKHSDAIVDAVRV